MSRGHSDTAAVVEKMIRAEKLKATNPTFAAVGETNSNDLGDERELADLKKWITTLSDEDLTRAMEFAFHSENGDGGGATCDEYDLVNQMVSMQPPPPTPIHPRALLHRPASAHGVTDGRNQEEKRRKSRFYNPRIFQLIERENSDGVSLFDGDVSQSLHALHKGGTKKRPQRKFGKRHSHVRYFDVLARRFSSPWGEVLTVGTTLEQQTADANLLEWTRLKSNRKVSSRCCLFCPSGRSLNKPDVLRVLHIASRGKFLSRGQRKENTSFPFCSLWFDPTAQWFSLPMYLASRYEVALWNSFHRKHIEFKESNIFGAELISELPGDGVRRAIAEAVHKATADVLGEGLESDRIRDSLLAQLLSPSNSSIPFSFPKFNPASLFTIPLIEVGSAKDKFRLTVVKQLCEVLARQSEKQLLITSCAKSLSEDGSDANRGGKKKKKKKKTRKRHSISICAGNEARSDVQRETQQGTFSDDLPPDHIPQFSCRLPSEERNRNTIVALLVIEDVIGRVFEKVGLTSPDGDKELAVQGECVRSKLAKLPPKVPQRKLTAMKKPCQMSRAVGRINENNKGEAPTSSSLPLKLEGAGAGASAIVQHSSGSTDEPSLSTLSQSSAQQQHNNNQTEFSLVNPNDGPLTNVCDSQPSSPFFDMTSPLGMSLNFGGAFGEWGDMKRFQSREKSLFAEFFNRDSAQKDVEEILMAASTAASIASSRGDEKSEIQQDDVDAGYEKIADAEAEDGSKSLNEIDDDKSLVATNVTEPEQLVRQSNVVVSMNEPNILESHSMSELSETQHNQSPPLLILSSPPVAEDAESPSPSEPPTPPPQLSPIQVSLADISKLTSQKSPEELRKEFVEAISNKFSSSPEVAGSLRSLPGSPKLDQSKRSWSREDLRASYFQDDHVLKCRAGELSRQAEANLSYRNKATKALKKAFSSCSQDALKNGEIVGSKPLEPKILVGSEKAAGAAPGPLTPSKEQFIEGDFHVSPCAQSETALEGHDDTSHWNATQRISHNDEIDNVTATRDGTTTISSGHTPHEAEEITLLREERNAYRDLCLTLGAEVAKLKNQIASQLGNNVHTAVPYVSSPLQAPYYYSTSSYDPEFMPSFFNGGHQSSNRTFAAMSDAGIHQDVSLSEDGTDIAQGALSIVDSTGIHWSGHPNSVGNARQTSTVGTKTASDTCSTDFCHGSVAFSGFRSMPRENHGSVQVHGLQSRLSIDVETFLRATSSQLEKQETRRMAATKRLSRLVTALWPRAQVKLYGSHVSNLCLPSSDIDYVICLPAVHKKDIAVAPGVLEGRNAINETSQKMLARKLKGESWIDPRSIKLIERTIVPVIKVSTKDTRARVLQLDISFDGPEHHGLDAVQMVTNVVEEFPLVRPLVLVLKQFLLDRGLLTAYTGGLSSYCLFLMVTRYLQEQPSWNDCGTLLMGFLDFYGNSFDPRSTGISVRRRQYFPRPYYAQQAAAHSHHALEHQIWNAAHQQQPLASTASQIGGDPAFPDLSSRRHSFSEAARVATTGSGAMSSSPTGKLCMKPPRFHPKRTSSHHSLNQQHTQLPQQHQSSPLMQGGRPYTFDPLFVEDPMNAGNNVGRNAFRILQVQRAFSDAHRALVASLEWDMNSTIGLNDSDCPLLKCLFNNEDTFFCDGDIPDSRP